ncbi:MAG: hypothetical protein ACYDEJ_16215 [Desulfitobacteriaceae bacterium]
MKRVKSFLIHQDAQMLLSLVDKKAILKTALLNTEKLVRPETSISENSLFTCAVHKPSMISELKKEILSQSLACFRGILYATPNDKGIFVNQAMRNTQRQTADKYDVVSSLPPGSAGGCVNAVLKAAG